MKDKYLLIKVSEFDESEIKNHFASACVELTEQELKQIMNVFTDLLFKPDLVNKIAEVVENEK